MKRFLVLILLFLMATQAFSKWVMLMEYNWNKEYIAANLCENKAKPKLKCEGKCQLAKKMAEEENESSSQSNTKSKFQEIVYTDEILSQPFFSGLAPSSGYFSFYLLKQNNAPVLPVFHPPA